MPRNSDRTALRVITASRIASNGGKTDSAPNSVIGTVSHADVHKSSPAERLPESRIISEILERFCANLLRKALFVAYCQTRIQIFGIAAVFEVTGVGGTGAYPNALTSL
ncbi:hypothetical protein JCM31271_09110 [Halorubrum trueperi]